MAKIYNQSGALKDLLKKLNTDSIRDFSDVKSILNYKKNWEVEVKHKFNSFKDNFIKSNEKLKFQITQDRSTYDRKIEDQQEQYHKSIEYLSSKIKEREEYVGNWIFTIVKRIQLYISKRRLQYLNNNSEKFIYTPFSALKVNIDSKEKKLNYNREHYTVILNVKKEKLIQNAQRILDCFSKYKRELSGAIGEEKAIKQLKKLSDDYIVINDFKLKFNRPIVNSKDNYKIFSIQADHLVIASNLQTWYPPWDKLKLTLFSLGSSKIVTVQRQTFSAVWD